MHSRIIQEPVHLDKLKVFLQENKLPFQDVSLSDSYYLIYQNDEGQIVASGGLELYGNCALLRSIAVDGKYRGQMIGHQVVLELLNEARHRQLKSIYLLTETAQRFFEQRGFAIVNRSVAPTQILQSTEFKSTCPASAICMHKSLL